ncbi:hypothetical protein BJ138DRAFT_1189019, partial [Hygrophoropsis aurantiaca]
MSATREITPASFNTILAVNLDTYEKTTTKSKAGKSKAKETKIPKSKEVEFTVIEVKTNYLDLLTTMLAKHGKDEYKVTDKKTYSFKYLAPPAKSRNDAMDIDNVDDFLEMAKKLICEKPDKVKIWIDMKSVEKLPSRARGQTAGDGNDSDNDTNGGADEDSDTAGVTEASDLERGITRFRKLIIKKWGNEHDNSITYVHPAGVNIPCTPLMIRDWAIALYEGTATLTHAPNIESFDPAKREVALHPSRKAHMPVSSSTAVISPAPTSANTDITALTSMLLLQTAQGLARDRFSSTPPVVPETPKSSSSMTAPASPAIPTPTKLSRFLQYAEKTLGVRNARLFEASLRDLGAGPDVIPLMADADLARAGLNPGDIIRLKTGSPVWWNGPDAKRKRSDTQS